MDFVIPSPFERINYTPLSDRGISLFVKRDDLIHPEVSGNKWRKLRLHVEKALQMGHDTLLTFGGAFSNHIAATAAAGHILGMRTIGVIRGLHADRGNPTLSFAESKGMHLHFLSTQEYTLKSDYAWVKGLQHEFGTFYTIPEGGAGFLGVQGCVDILKEMDLPVHRIFAACGTATTLSGLALGNTRSALVTGVSALKGGAFLRDVVASNLKQCIGDAETETELLDKVEILTEYHFGGYAKTTPALIQFMREFLRDTGIRLDPVYTAKAAFALANEGSKHTGDPQNWVLLHSGGLQGTAGVEARLGEGIYP